MFKPRKLEFGFLSKVFCCGFFCDPNDEMSNLIKGQPVSL